MSISSIVSNILAILQQIVYLIVGLGLLVFLYGIFGYISNFSDEKKRQESVSYIIYGLLGLFVMISVWGLVGILTGSFGLSNAIPQISI